MVKRTEPYVIDRTGQVLVLRPDVTIPITREIAQNFPETGFFARRDARLGSYGREGRDRLTQGKAMVR